MNTAAYFLIFIGVAIVSLLLFVIFSFFVANNSATRLESSLTAMLTQQFTELHAKLQAELFANTSKQARENREEIMKSMTVLGQANAEQLKKLSDGSHKQLDEMRVTLDRRLSELQTSNDKRLEEMRKTVDEKLKDTLEKRLTQSFESVGRMLSELREKFAEMRAISSDFQGLKKAFTNVKNRGGIGEMQLENIISDVLAPQQFEKNAKIQKKSAGMVEFAVKIPGENGHSLLPIDSKFPTSAYDAIISAQESGIKNDVRRAQDKFVTTINNEAKKIHDKYISPPETTDYAVLFLPSEALYAEAAQLSLTAGDESPWRKYRVMVTGPSTLTAILSSFRSAFNLMAMTKHQSEAFRILHFLQDSFVELSKSLADSEKQIEKAGDGIRKVRKRTTKIEEELSKVDKFDATSDLARDLPIDRNKGSLEGESLFQKK